ncbi:hypothetical protein [Xenophilus sp. Marseille-Q4582]|uniref:hypothetical protein n=1 Tax=Xenophilus sp. Marseille-Q4582 TaxID=2866600 RepID=UPI001CE4AB3E|nr:hypothetical protein [Xenophilus sp. Marseille-Q4582]
MNAAAVLINPRLRARRLAALRRRLAHLDQRLASDTAGKHHRDRAEAAALRWALETIEARA